MVTEPRMQVAAIELKPENVKTRKSNGASCHSRQWVWLANMVETSAAGAAAGGLRLVAWKSALSGSQHR